jgi:hypothetical protein
MSTEQINEDRFDTVVIGGEHRTLSGRAVVAVV